MTTVSTLMEEFIRFGFLLGLMWPITVVLTALCFAAAIFSTGSKSSGALLLTIAPYFIACAHVVVGIAFRQKELGPAPFPILFNALVFLAVCATAANSVRKSKERRFAALSHACLAIWVAMSFAFTANMLISTGCEDM